MHLTNYSLNKKNKEFEIEDFGEDSELEIGTTGCKRTFSHVMDHFKKSGIDTNRIWGEIKNLTRMLLASIQPFLIFEFDCSFRDSEK